MNLTNIIILFLILFILIYIYNDIITPFIKYKLSSTTASTASTALTTSTTSTTSDNKDKDKDKDKYIENFSQYSSLSQASKTNNNTLENTTQFDTNWYLRDNNNKNNTNYIISNNKIQLPVIRYGFYDNNAYEYYIGQYFRHHIYPVSLEKLNTNLDTIYKFINNDIDIAFINEELLTRYIKKDCKYLTQLIINNLGLTTYDTSSQKNIDTLYPPVNFSAIGVGFHQDFYLIVNNYSNIIDFLDINNKTIGILNDSYYSFIKLCSAYGIESSNLINTETITGDTNNTSNTNNNISIKITLEEQLENLIKTFITNKYDGIFIITHPKNKQLLDLSLKMKLRFIHIQKRDTIDARNNLSNITQFQDKETQLQLPIQQQPLTRILQDIYDKKNINNVQTENIKQSVYFNTIIKKYFQYITPRSVDLNKFHKSGNLYSYLETYTTRMILVIRNDIPKEHIKYITQNYITNLTQMRDTIDKEQFQEQINNFSSLEFNYNELISFDNKIQLADGAKDIYKNEGLIYYKETMHNRI